MSGIVIKAYRPGRRRLWISLVVSAAISAAIGIYGFAYQQAARDKAEVMAENARLRGEAVTLQEELGRLRELRALSERGRQIEEQAHKELESTISGLQSQVTSLKAEVAFYRTVAAPQESARGLRIGGFEASRKGEGYRYRLMLTQVQRNETGVEGEITLTVEGLLNGKSKSLPLKLLTPGQAKVPFKFKYFGTVEGDLSFPAEFVPQRVAIKVSPQGKKHPEFEETFKWPVEEG